MASRRRRINHSMTPNSGRSPIVAAPPSGGISTITRRHNKVFSPPKPELLTPEVRQRALESTADKAAEAVAVKIDLPAIEATAESVVTRSKSAAERLRAAVADGRFTLQEVLEILEAIINHQEQLGKSITDVGRGLVHEGARLAVGDRAAADTVHSLHNILVNRGILPSGSTSKDVSHGAAFPGDVRLDLVTLSVLYGAIRGAKVIATPKEKLGFADSFYSSQRPLPAWERLAKYTYMQGAEAGPVGKITINLPAHATHLAFNREVAGTTDIAEVVYLDRAAMGLTSASTSVVITCAAGDARYTVATVGTAPAMRVLREASDGTVAAGGFYIEVWSRADMSLVLDASAAIEAVGTVTAYAADFGFNWSGPAFTAAAPWLRNLLGRNTPGHGGGAETSVAASTSFTP